MCNLNELLCKILSLLRKCVQERSDKFEHDNCSKFKKLRHCTFESILRFDIHKQ